MQIFVHVGCPGTETDDLMIHRFSTAQVSVLRFSAGKLDHFTLLRFRLRVSIQYFNNHLLYDMICPDKYLLGAAFKAATENYINNMTAAI